MRRALPWLAAGLGAVLLVVGVTVFALASSADFGWTAYTGSYAPLEPDAGAVRSELFLFSDGAVLWTRRHAVGAGLAALGLLVLVGLAGWLVGRRSVHGGAVHG
jgi:hypothetical protein